MIRKFIQKEGGFSKKLSSPQTLIIGEVSKIILKNFQDYTCKFQLLFVQNFDNFRFLGLIFNLF